MSHPAAPRGLRSARLGAARKVTNAATLLIAKRKTDGAADPLSPRVFFSRPVAEEIRALGKRARPKPAHPCRMALSRSAAARVCVRDFAISAPLAAQAGECKGQCRRRDKTLISCLKFSQRNSLLCRPGKKRSTATAGRGIGRKLIKPRRSLGGELLKTCAAYSYPAKHPHVSVLHRLPCRDERSLSRRSMVWAQAQKALWERTLR